MWPIPRITHDFVIIIFSQKSISALLLRKNKSHQPYDVVGYEEEELKTHASAFTLFNLSEYITFIKSFLDKHNQQNAFIGFVITDAYMEHEYKIVPSQSVTLESLGISPASNMTSGYQFAYNNKHGQAAFYVYRVSKALLLQYMLIGLHIPLNLITITPEHICLLESYKALKGSTFRQAELNIALENNAHNITKCIPYDVLKEKITLPPSLKTDHIMEKIACAYGLFRAQGFPL